MGPPWPQVRSGLVRSPPALRFPSPAAGCTSSNFLRRGVRSMSSTRAALSCCCLKPRHVPGGRKLAPFRPRCGKRPKPGGPGGPATSEGGPDGNPDGKGQRLHEGRRGGGWARDLEKVRMRGCAESSRATARRSGACSKASTARRSPADSPGFTHPRTGRRCGSRAPCPRTLPRPCRGPPNPSPQRQAQHDPVVRRLVVDGALAARPLDAQLQPFPVGQLQPTAQAQLAQGLATAPAPGRASPWP